MLVPTVLPNWNKRCLSYKSKFQNPFLFKKKQQILRKQRKKRKARKRKPDHGLHQG